MQALKAFLQLCAAHLKVTAACCAAACCVTAYCCFPGHDDDDRKPSSPPVATCIDVVPKSGTWSCKNPIGQTFYSNGPAQCAQYYPNCTSKAQVPQSCLNPKLQQVEKTCTTATATATATKTATATATVTAISTSTSTNVYTFPSAPGRTCNVDTFTQNGGTSQYAKKLDLLFVMDHSGSMDDNWQRVATNIESLVKQLPATTDIRYGVILGDVGAWSGKMYNPLGLAYLDNQKLSTAQIAADLQKTFSAGMKVTDAGSGEALFYSLYKAVTTQAAANQRAGFFRPDAALSVLFMSDEQEIGFPFPSHAQLAAQGLPIRCDEAFEDGVKAKYYDAKGINMDVTFAAVQKLKGQLPLKMNAFINITKADLFLHNSSNAKCLYDSIGYGYPDIVAKTNGVLYSIEADKAAGLTQCGQAIAASLALQHDFPLSEPASGVDPATVLASVDGAAAPGVYTASSDSEHLDNAGQNGSVIQVRYCAPAAAAKPVWSLTGFAGTAAQTTVGLSWQTAQHATSGKVLYGTSASNLNNEMDESGTATNHALTVSGLSPNTVYYFQAVSTDEFAQTQSSAVLSFRTLPAWSISGVAAQAARTTASVSWNTAEYPTSGYVLWGSSTDGLTNQSALAASANAHSVELGGLTPSTTYFYQVVADDDLGQSARSAVNSFTTQADWGITGFAGTPSITSVALSWSTPDQATTGVVLYGASSGALASQVADTVNGVAHSANVGGLAPDTDYYFQTVATDASGAKKVSAVILVHTTAANWQVTGFAGTSTQTSVTVSWTTPGFATSGSVAWGDSGTSLPNVVLDTVNGTSHSATITGLTAGTVYYFEATSTDQYGDQRSSAVIAVSTAAIPLPNWSITGLAGVATTTSVTISWSTHQYATSGAVLSGLSAATLGNQVNDTVTGTAHSVTISGLSPNTLYSFRALGADDRGQTQQSAVIQVSTLADVVVIPPVTTPPVTAPTDPTSPVTPVTPVGAWSIVGFDGTTTASAANLIWTTPGAATTAVVKVGTSANDLSLMSIPVSAAAETQQLSVTGLAPNTQYFLQVIATDSAGTSQESVVISKTTKAQ